MSIKNLKQDWEDMAELDPLWAILSVPEKQYNKWNVDEFFDTGKIEVQRLFSEIKNFDNPKNFKRVLDFGCGVGRITRAFANKFEECVGVDISYKMIQLAKKMNSSFTNCRFVLNEKADLKIFDNNYFDMIYASIVLQHISDTNIIKSYISEFVRILVPGGLLVFQLPSYIPQNMRIQIGAMEFSDLRQKGQDAKFLYEKRKLNPIKMNFIPQEIVLSLLKSKNTKILKVKHDGMAGDGIQSKTYFVSK